MYDGEAGVEDLTAMNQTAQLWCESAVLMWPKPQSLTEYSGPAFCAGEAGKASPILSAMCGIVGYVGPNNTIDVLLSGLKRLEYRGYDSAGVAVIGDDGAMHSRKKAGKLNVLADSLANEPLPEGHTGIGHTRWATHGAPTDANAHPHFGDDGKLALIHNGIIENYQELKDELAAQGFSFSSETDTEVAAVLLGAEYEKTHDLYEAFRIVVSRLSGAFTLLAIHQDQPGVVVGARRNSPLVIGRGRGENFLASDVGAFVEHTRRALAIGQDEIAVITADDVTVTDFAGNTVAPSEFEIPWDAKAAERGGWRSFMEKEISEQPEALRNTLLGHIKDGQAHFDSLGAIDDEFLARMNRVVVVAAGTAAFAAMTARYAFEKWTRVVFDVELAHEFRYRDPVIDENTLVISVSQSGETMDTLMATHYATEHGVKTLSICNTQGATIPRESDGVIYTHAGPEIAVASTKAFTSQITAIYLFALYVAKVRGTLSDEKISELLEDLSTMPDKAAETLAGLGRIPELAKWMADTRSVLYLGRHVGYPIALEGALKLKEVAYVNTEGFAAGELKHGSIALIEPGQPVFVIMPSPRNPLGLHAKVLSNIQEIRARGAHIIAIVEIGDVAVLPFVDEAITIPLASVYMQPILSVIPLQAFAMELSTARGLDVDQPRNLAKSVTVE